jgi:hypothetical protein
MRDANLRLSVENQSLREESTAAREAQTQSDRGREQKVLQIRGQQDRVLAELAQFAEELAKI